MQVKTNDECKQKFIGLKFEKTSRFIIYNIVNEEIVIFWWSILGGLKSRLEIRELGVLR